MVLILLVHRLPSPARDCLAPDKYYLENIDTKAILRLWLYKLETLTNESLDFVVFVLK